MHVIKRVHSDWFVIDSIDQVIDRVIKWSSERAIKWSTERSSDRPSEWSIKRASVCVHTHRRTTSHNSVISAQIINFICSVVLNLHNKRTCVPLCVLDHPWVFFPRASWALSQQNPRVFWYYLLSCYNAKTEIRLAGSVLMERFATINLLISSGRMLYGYQSNMVCNTNDIC